MKYLVVGQGDGSGEAKTLDKESDCCTSSVMSLLASHVEREDVRM